MQTLETWKEFLSIFYAEVKSVVESGDYLSIHGYFDPLIPDSELELPIDVYKISETVGDIVEKSFPALKVEGLQTPNTSYTETSDKYGGLIFGKDSSDKTIVSIVMSVSHCPTPSNFCAFVFYSIFQLGEYETQSKEALTQMWHLVRGIESATSIIPEGTKEIDNKKYQQGCIALMEGDKPIATGYAAFREIGLDLEEKDITLMGGVSSPI